MAIAVFYDTVTYPPLVSLRKCGIIRACFIKSHHFSCMLIRFASLILVFALFTNAAFAMSSTNYLINWDNINSGGNELGTSTNFSVYDTLGDNASGTSTSATYTLSAGYRASEQADQLSLDVRSEDSGTQIVYSAFDNAGGTVTVASATGFSVGDYIAVVENVGFSELVSVGKIASIAGTTLTVDGFDGNGGTMSAVPAGGDDFVYRLTLNAVAFGSVSASVENVSATVSSVFSTVASGYSVYIQADQELQDAAADIMTSVTDGSVSLASEEYGSENVGTFAVNANTDLGVTTTQRVVQTSGVDTGGVPDRVAMLYKLAVTDATVAGTYTQTVLYTLTANY